MNDLIDGWTVSATAQKQSNYGRWKAGLHRGEGMTFETVQVTASTSELALQMARNAAVASELLAALEGIIKHYHGDPIVELFDAHRIIAKAKGLI